MSASLVLGTAALLLSCSADVADGTGAARDDGPTEPTSAAGPPVRNGTTALPAAPIAVPTGGLSPEVAAARDALLADLETSIALAVDVEMTVRAAPLEIIAGSGDVRLGWVLSDLLRFMQGTTGGDALASAAQQLTGLPLDPAAAWTPLTDALIAWDVPAPPDYVAFKRRAFEAIDTRWSFLFDDPDAAIDYRLVSWGGVLIDDRPLGSTGPCPSGCIPSLDDPALVPAAAGAGTPTIGWCSGWRSVAKPSPCPATSWRPTRW
ncbi:MAG: hypothetical protein R2755_22020 [Acidimicrobiales bacterium]